MRDVIQHEPIIEVTNLAKSFGSQAVLREVSFAVPRGTVFALLGANGAGKTTIINILSTLIPYDHGSIQVGGHDLLTNPGAVRSMIGLTGQFAAVDGFQTGRENLVMMGVLANLGHHAARDRADELLHQFDLVEAAHRSAETYSGGMRRRLDIAMSLVARPDLLFLDEPTTGLDPRSRIALWQMVRDLVRTGVTVFLTTQYLEEADQLADDIAVIHQGAIIARGTASELKKRVGGQQVKITFSSPTDLIRAAELLNPTATSLETLSLSMASEDPPSTIRIALKAMQDKTIPIANLAITQPTLDDVFFNLTQ